MLNIMEDIDAARKTTKEALEVISGSINYASHIQKAILPDSRLFSDAFSDYFIQWKPRDVVGRGIPQDTEYTEKRIKLQSGQKFYMTSDGLLDQIGGEKRRSFGKKRLKKLMVSLAEVPFGDHGTHIYKALVEYQGKESRRDDVAVFGFKI